MNNQKTNLLTRREFVGTATAFMIVPRHVLGGPGYVPPSDRITLAAIGMGHQVVAVCDCNKSSMDYVEYDDNALLKEARALLGPGYENWGADLASPGEVQL